MGGYGAFKAALTCPERYAAACSLSGVAAIFGMFEAERMSALTYAQAELFIGELRRRAAGLGADRLTEPQYRKIMAMTRTFGWKPENLRAWLRRVTGVEEVRWLTDSRTQVQ